ncbi:uncharacterized protein LOC144331013 [Macaca mulatta]
MQIGSLPPRPSPREAGGGRGGEERGRGRGRGGGGEERGRGARRAPGASGRSESGGARLQPAKRPPARRGPAPAAAAAARRLRALQPRRHPRGTAPDPLPGAPVRAAPGPRTAFSGPAGRSRGASCQPAAFRHRGPAWPPRSSAAARRARAVRCTCSSAGRQPTLGQHSPGETNPSAARRASGLAPLAPAVRCSAPLPPPPESQTPANGAAVAAASQGLGAHRAPAAGAV